MSRTLLDNSPLDKTPLDEMYWRLHLPNFLNEIMKNPGTEILKIPMQVFAGLMDQIVLRASQLNDPILNAYMCRLALYEIADPENKEAYDFETVKEVFREAKELKEKLAHESS